MNTRLPAIALLAALAAAAPASAFDIPQNRQEFVKAVSDGRGATTVEKIQSGHPLDKIWAVLAERAPACLDVTVQRTAYVGYVERSSSDYTPTLKRVGKDRAEFTLQVLHNPRGVGGGPPPPGGLYYMAADLRAIDGGRTEIVFYHGTIGVKKIVASLKEWFEADPTDCPKLR